MELSSIPFINKFSQREQAKGCFFAAATSFGLFVVIGLIHLSTSSRQSSTSRRPMVIWTDLRDDDVIALNYILHRSDIDVKLVVASGNALAHPNAVLRNLKAVLSVVTKSGGGGVVSALSVSRGSPFAKRDRSTHNCSYSCMIPSRTRLLYDTLFGTSDDFLAGNDAGHIEVQPLPHALADLAENSEPRSLEVLVLSAATDIAWALEQQQGVAEKIHRVTMSGGAIHAGDTNQYFPRSEVESNFFLDPEAATSVIFSQIPNVHVVARDAAVKYAYGADANVWNRLQSSPQKKNSPLDVTGGIAAILRGYYTTFVPHSRFAIEALPHDLVAAMIAAGPLTRSVKPDTQAGVAVGVHTWDSANGDLARVGQLGSRSSGRGVGLTLSVAGDVWKEYELVTGSAWPMV